MTSYIDELKRAIEIRLRSIASIVEDLKGALPSGRHSLRSAFLLFQGFEEAVSKGIATKLPQLGDDLAEAGWYEHVLQHLIQVADLIELYLSHGEHPQLTEALCDEVRDELTHLDLGNYEVILAHGEAGNFSTVCGDIYREIYSPLNLENASIDEEARDFALFLVPRIEGSGVYWKPILIGHEVAHAYIDEHDVASRFELRRKLDLADTIADMDADADDFDAYNAYSNLDTIANNWLTELMCDFYALHRYGPSAIASLGEYLTAVGAFIQIEEGHVTHPPAMLRLKLLLNELELEEASPLGQMVAPWKILVDSASDYTTEWISRLANFFASYSSNIMDVVKQWPAQKYHSDDRVEHIQQVAKEISQGSVVPHVIDNFQQVPTAADIVNGVWLARVENASTEQRSEELEQLEALGRKCLENVAFVAQWHSASLPLPTNDQALPQNGLSEIRGALSSMELWRRLQSTDPESKLIVSPLLYPPKGVGLDLRLGYRFILFRRSQEVAFDPLDLDYGPRRVQVFRELSRSETIVLHPHEMVLAATLEFLVLPPDVTAQVVTRSSYGRLGLLSATAVQVHPNFHGCLTLELVNLSNLPLVLTPGERVAQLVASSTSPVASAEEKYHCPIGPEFSKARIDDEADALRQFRRSNKP